MDNNQKAMYTSAVRVSAALSLVAKLIEDIQANPLVMGLKLEDGKDLWDARNIVIKANQTIMQKHEVL